MDMIILKIINKKKKPKVKYFLLNPENETVLYGTMVNYSITLRIPEVELWNPDNPKLYTLLIETEYEVIKEKVGMRIISIEDKIIKLNGESIKLKGVNHHDSHPSKGYVMTNEDLLLDLKLMKPYNFNSIRTAHYPKSSIFYEMCDEYEFLVMNEADIEMWSVGNESGFGCNFENGLIKAREIDNYTMRGLIIQIKIEKGIKMV